MTPTDPDFSIFNPSSILSAVTAATGTFTMLLGAVAAISLLVGGIGVMNIMLVTVTERTREIGIRKAIGAQRGDIVGQFLLEAVLLSMFGGLLGVAIGVVVGQPEVRHVPAGGGPVLGRAGVRRLRGDRAVLRHLPRQPRRRRCARSTRCAMSEPAEIDPFGAEWDRPRLTNRLTWVLVAAVVAALTFAGGLLIERQYDSTIVTAARGGARTTGGRRARGRRARRRPRQQARRSAAPGPEQARAAAGAAGAGAGSSSGAGGAEAGSSDAAGGAAAGSPDGAGGSAGDAPIAVGTVASVTADRLTLTNFAGKTDHRHRAPERDGHHLRARGSQARRPGLGDGHRQPRRLRHRHLHHQPDDRRMTARREGRTR